jgi:thiamine biosynthesis lipoprotein
MIFKLSILILFLAFLSCAREEEPFVKQTFVMGTRGTITIYGLASEDADSAASEAIREMHRIESVMSNWKEDSEVSRLNRDSQGQPVSVSPELFFLINKACLFSKLTGGAFDVTAMPVVKLWGFQGGEVKLPSETEIAGALEKVGWRKMILDAGDTTIALTEGAGIDLAGIGKGYAVDRCVWILKKHGATSALVDLGGNMFAMGKPPDREAWSIGIRDPRDPSSVIGKLVRQLRELRRDRRKEIRAYCRSAHRPDGRSRTQRHSHRSISNRVRCPLDRTVRSGSGKMPGHM